MSTWLIGYCAKQQQKKQQCVSCMENQALMHAIMRSGKELGKEQCLQHSAHHKCVFVQLL